MEKADLQLALRTEAEDLDRTAAEYEKLLGGGSTANNIRATAVIIFRAMANAKRSAAATLD